MATGRLSLLAFTGVTAAVHSLPEMPGWRLWAVIVVVLIAVSAFIVLCKVRCRWLLLLPLWAAAIGLSLTVARIEHRLSDVLAEGNVNKVTWVVLRIASLPRMGPGSRQFEAQLISSKPEGVPKRILVSWSSAQGGGPYQRQQASSDDFPALIPGQVWQMALILKPPHGLRNPHGFDYEAYAFSQGIRATATVRGQPLYLRDEAWANLSVIADRARYRVRQAMLAHIQNKRYGAVMLALAIGDQASVESSDWRVFSRTGITHLVSISGSHITLVAALGGGLVFALWRRLRWRDKLLAERIPAQIVAAFAALFIAWLYCLLAGWGVPARRTFVMLAVIACAYLLRLPLNASRVLAAAAFVVVALDPWAVISAGFWLSYAAVAVLMAGAGWQGRMTTRHVLSGRRRFTQGARRALGLQLTITAGLMPLLAWLFHEVSLIAPLVNAYAIAIVSFLVTPLSLLLAVAALLPGMEATAAAIAWLGHGVLSAMMVPTVWLGTLPMASVPIPAAPLFWTSFGMLGLVWALLPRGMPGRRLGWLAMAPALIWQPARPPLGGWDLYALDVGQAGAIVLRTAKHTVLFDTGVRSSPSSDSGTRVIRPFLQAIGVTSLDVMVVSHEDIDHAGGVRSILESMQVQQAYSAFDLAAYLAREARLLGISGQLPSMPLSSIRCEYGERWHVDEVEFHFLWPLANEGSSSLGQGKKKKNDQGCVLMVRGKYHSALLTGDIGSQTEQTLVNRTLLPVDIVLAAHHGSKTSSSRALTRATQAQHVLAQVGAWSRYGHPHAEVESRWTESGSQFWRTDRHGALTVQSREGTLLLRAERQAAKRYWQSY